MLMRSCPNLSSGLSSFARGRLLSVPSPEGPAVPPVWVKPALEHPLEWETPIWHVPDDMHKLLVAHLHVLPMTLVQQQQVRIQIIRLPNNGPS